eukprot:c19881_g1_i1.p1 GENE.c19881_g1_i1~~c19881_g1_i1.p1  ORF type:complete len:933 (-),score=253.19 c19881_g1_i1:48-2846(-)
MEFTIENDQDVLYEEDVIRTPFEVKPWLRYLHHKIDAPQKARNLLYERALSYIPGSYKLWLRYVEERVRVIKHLCIDHPAYSAVINVFERCLVFMHKMPRIWIEYLKFLTPLMLITHTRRAFDRALRSLAITQHYKVWPLYLKFVRRANVDELTLRVYRRYLKIEPDDVEPYIDILKKMGKDEEAAYQLANALNSESFVSKKGSSRHELWMELCSMISKHPDKITRFNVDAVIRQGIRRYTADVGRLWVALGDYYIRSDHFDKARDVFHEAITTVVTVRDFSLVFDAYTQFEESLITAKMEGMENNEEDEEENSNQATSDPNSLTADLKLFDDEDADDIDLRLLRLEHLTNNRPQLLNSVLLRQNPHNVHEWHKRARLFEKDPKMVVLTYSEAVQTVDPYKAKGKPHTLWVAFAKFYEKHKSLKNARKTFETAVKAPLRHVEDLGALWCEYAEMELRHDNHLGALELMKRATAGWQRFAQRNQHDESIPVQQRVHKSVRLWSLYADLQESLGTVLETKEVYDQMVHLKVVTPQHIINLATFLEENKYYEESFRAFEKGVALFSFPAVKDIWLSYLTKFIARYQGTKLERARDLFEQSLEKAPADQCKELYLMYARLEEAFGLARHAMAIYERATHAVDDKAKFEIYEIYIARATEFFGVTRTREIYEKAIDNVPDSQVKDMCVRYAGLERKLGEIDRARAIYTHMAQYCDPRVAESYWKVWNDFEVAHGNEETFRDMLRIKRNVKAQYTQANIMVTSMVAATPVESDADFNRRIAMGAGSLVDEMQALEAAATSAMANKRVSALDGAANGGVEGANKAPPQRVTSAVNTNPEEIELGDMDADDDDDNDKDVGDGQHPQQGNDEDEEMADASPPTKRRGGVEIEQVAVPSAVFGSVAAIAEQVAAKEKAQRDRPDDQTDQSEKPKGALARFKR